QKLVEKIENQAKQHPHERVLDVELQADGRGEVPDHRLAEPVHADVEARKRILRDAENEADGETAYLRTTHQREINGDEQRQIDLRNEAKRLKQRQVDLDEQRHERHYEETPDGIAGAPPLAGIVDKNTAGVRTHQRGVTPPLAERAAPPL